MFNICEMTKYKWACLCFRFGQISDLTYSVIIFSLLSITIHHHVPLFHPYTPQHHVSHHHLCQADLELNQIEYESGEEELRSLEKRFSVLESEYDQIMERRRLAEEKRQTEMRELELKIKAAIFAQAWWRGYSTRKALKNRGKSKTAKKGKGKKR